MNMRQSLVILVGLTFIVAGCHRPTAEDRDNRRLIDAILTSITIKNARLLGDNLEWAQKRHDAGHLTDAQFEGMATIIEKARTGDWAGAEKDGYAFRKRHPFVKDGH
jgi:hypothetical protein